MSQELVYAVGKPWKGFDARAARLWFGAAGPGPQTRLFRKTFDLVSAPEDTKLRIFAESRYHVWINGQYLGRGPIFHHPDRLPVDTYTLRPKEHLVLGRNAIAVLVQAPDISFHNHVCSGEPGLVAQLDRADDGPLIVSDASWRVSDQAGWRSNPPRRSWAIDYLEEFDMTAAPSGWQEPGFDDSHWLTPDTFTPATRVPDGQFILNPLPSLKYHYQRPCAVLGRYTITESPSSLRPFASNGDLGKSIMDAQWMPRDMIDIDLKRDDFIVTGLTPDRGALLSFDLGQEFVGQVVLECDCPSAGVIDVGWSEILEEGRPRLVRKGVGYVDRIHATRGVLRWEPIQFSGMRYLVLVLRGFDGPLRVRRFGVRASEPDLSWHGEFSSSDERLNRIFDLCVRSQRVGTQEGQMDCPTREQAAYIGDGVLTARWLAQLTGDVRHWRHLVYELFHRQSPSGILRAAIFSGRNDSVIDYTLWAVVGVRDYVRFTGDVDTAHTLIRSARLAFSFFDRYRDTDGLCTWTFEREQPPATWENHYDPALPVFGESQGLILFIDHPGLGWHNKNEAGIDRRGINAALNALIVIARRALADLEEIIGDAPTAQTLRADADHLADLCDRAFFDKSRQLYVDGIVDGQRVSQISEQTNTLAIAARLCDDDTARTILHNLLTTQDSAIARNGPYFWAYLYPEILRLGLHDLALNRTRVLWGHMLDGGASTLWETFLGDDLDSWCHPWSAAPLDLIFCGLLGLPGISRDEIPPVLRPRFDLLSQANGRVYTRHGWCQIEWSRQDDTVQLHGSLPKGIEATVHDPAGRPIVKVHANWSLTIKL